MDQESQKLLNALKYNEHLTKLGIEKAKQFKEKLQQREEIDTNINEADEAIKSSLKLLEQLQVKVDLPQQQKVYETPFKLHIKPNVSEYKSFETIVEEAHAAGFENTAIEDLLTAQEVAEADAEYLAIKKAFSEKTKLTKGDIAFLLLTVALQVARQFIFSNEKFRLKATEADNALKKPLKKVTPNTWHDILFGPVPYDAVVKVNADSDSTGLSGYTHRYRTLGHDPVLGWIFGPINILTSTLTKTNFITTYQVVNRKIGDFYEFGTVGAFNDAVLKAQEDKLNLPAAVVKQAIHFGTDYFTKQGLPLPFVSSLDNDLAQKLVQQFNIDTYSVTRGATLSVFINSIVGLIHSLFYNPKKHGSRELYEVRTRKILLIANIIASTSNVIYVALSKDLKKLDLGGILVTIGRIISDLSFIAKIEQEFIVNRFDESFQKELDFLDSSIAKWI
ncbi:hypothetical protein [Bacillus sp. T3]|uniref:hypothetical protein n=1 Tax=Bacillus sp. T3 TaxID=467262 RepID=UPI0029810393|nr:hypothetical protein [Bacillus sp. T3]